MLILVILTHFMQLVSFYTPWKHEETSGFLIFSGGIERDQWHEMGSYEFSALIKNLCHTQATPPYYAIISSGDPIHPVKPFKNL